MTKIFIFIVESPEHYVEKKQFIENLKAKDEVQSIFLVKYIAQMEGKDGKSYINSILVDSTGEMEARKWQGAERIIQQIKTGDFVNIKGKMNLFQGRLQMIIEEMVLADREKINIDDFSAKAKEAPEKMMDELQSIVKNLDEVYIRELLLAILNDPEISRRLKVWQAGKSIHHAYKSGLLEHILSCTTLAVSLSAHYGVNTSYVVAGTILHDMCKIYELTEGPVVEYTEEGKLIGHLVKGLELVDHFSNKIKNFPNNQKMHIKHILLSHHGEYEYGSPKIPHTSEAYLVHLIDMMDSKMNAIQGVKEHDNNVGNWSGMVKHLDRTIYKKNLPSYKDFIAEDSDQSNIDKASPEKSVSLNQKTPVSKTNHEKPLKQNLGSLLKDFKVDEE